MIFLNRHSWMLFWEYNLLVGLYCLRWAHFGQHRNGGAILEISLLTWDLPCYSPQKKEIDHGGGASSVQSVQSIYLFKHRENKGNSFRNWKQKTLPSLSHSLTLAELPAPSDLLFRALVSMVLTRSLVCCCLSLSLWGKHILLCRCDC